MKVVLISGASSGIGHETAKYLQSKGYIVYAGARRIERMEDLKSLGIKTIKMDVTDQQSLITVVDTIISEQGKIDVLINNAGYGLYGALEEVSIESAKAQYDVNVFGLASLTQLVLPHMRKQKDGYILNISSIGGKITTPLGSWYHSSKFAVEGISDCLRQEVKQFGIKVVVIEPGAIKTEWSGIAVKNMNESSKTDAYKKITDETSKFFSNNVAQGSDPIVIAKCIAKAISKKNPKTRYSVGKLAKLSIFGRKVLSDKALDSVMSKMLKE